MKQNPDTDMNLIFVDWEAGAAKLRRVFSRSVVIAKIFLTVCDVSFFLVRKRLTVFTDLNLLK